MFIVRACVLTFCRPLRGPPAVACRLVTGNSSSSITVESLCRFPVAIPAKDCLLLLQPVEGGSRGLCTQQSCHIPQSCDGCHVPWVIEQKSAFATSKFPQVPDSAGNAHSTSGPNMQGDLPTSHLGRSERLGISRSTADTCFATQTRYDERCRTLWQSQAASDQTIHHSLCFIGVLTPD